MLFDPFDPLGLWPEHEAKEKRRRDQIGMLGRLKEDIPPFVVGCLILCGYFSIAVFPWLIGIHNIGTWIFGRAL
ncbi:hypothetical protein GR212_15935 [Rhizobium lusitanum]|uniref:Uncharacterized protein n=1 Tax=Rhizobium lusitanum TaxID=293958 RepID=A0A6L9UAC0_9HYPH|nr:hypothetical protein [Rhizobium lusitanum]NEI71070.1 hypothetical protein [Rhizobium lusitanum]